MIGALAISIWMYLFGAGLMVMGWVMTLRLSPEEKRPPMLRWLSTWTAKGMLLPFVIWGLMNVGLSWQLQPFTPAVQAAQNAGRAWFPEWLQVTSVGFFVVSSYWTSITLGWVLFTAQRGLHAESRSDLRALCFTCAAGLGIPALIIVLIGGWPLLGLAAAVILAPMAGYAQAVVQPKKMPPMYARAIARIKFGKYHEAEWEIIRELEKCEDDFDGWLMLAELYATRYNDIAEAERTVLDICDQPKLTPSQLAVALHRLADWQLKIASDPDAARRALQVIVDRFPGSHLARMANLRLNQIPATAAQWRQQQTPQPIPLPALTTELDTVDERPPEPADPEQGRRQADDYAERLKKDPNDPLTREKLARIFAEQLGRPDLGLEQLRLLLNLPEQSDHKRAEWLSLTAVWQMKSEHSAEAGRRTLERIIAEFPTTPQAFAARRRLVIMDREARKAPTN